MLCLGEAIGHGLYDWILQRTETAQTQRWIAAECGREGLLENSKDGGLKHLTTTVRAVPQHHVKITKTQERPTVHTEPGGKPQFVEKVAFSLLKILDRQNMLGGFYCKHGCPRSEEWILNNHYWNAGPSIQSTHRLRKTKQNHKSQQVTNLDLKSTPASLATTKHIATTTPYQTLNSNAQYWCNNMMSPQNSP